VKPDAKANRLTTAQSAQALLASLNGAESAKLIEVLASASIETSESAMNQTLGKAKNLDEAIRTAAWQLFEAVGSLSDQRKSAADAIMKRISEVLAADEHAIALKPALDEQQTKALRLLTDVQTPPPLPPDPPPPEPRLGDVVVKEAQATDVEPARAKSMLSEIGKELDKGSDLRLSIAWKIIRKGKTK